MQSSPIRLQVIPRRTRTKNNFFYQTLCGVFPLQDQDGSTLLQRVQEHMIKATREAMVHTRWTRPNQAHEEALRNFAARVLSTENDEFLRDFREFQRRIAFLGMVNGLSQTLVKITSPGV